MKTLIITLGGKGGVGKTLTLTTLADYLTTVGRPYAALDCDSENFGKASAFSSFLKDARTPNIRSISDCDRLLTDAAECDSGITLADLPANASGDFMSWFNSVVDRPTLEALNLRIFGIGAITPEPATFASVAEWAAKLQNRVDYIVALNHRTQQRVEKPKEEMFREYFGSDTGAKFRKRFDPAEVTIPSLYDGSMTILLRSGQLPSAAMNDQSLPLLDRTRIRTWVSGIHKNWEKSVNKLLPE